MAMIQVPVRGIRTLSQRNFRCLRGLLSPQSVYINRSQTCRHLTQNTASATHSHFTKNVDPDRKAVGQQLREEWARYNEFPEPSRAEDFKEGQTVTVHGFLFRKRIKSSKLAFADIQIDNGPAVQITSSFQEQNSPAHAVNQDLRGIPLHSPVSVTGTVAQLHTNSQPDDTLLDTAKADGETQSLTGSSRPGSFPDQVFRIDLDLTSIQPLNVFPKDIIVSKGVQFPPSSRHLQIRFSDALRTRLLVRPQIAFQLRKSLNDLAFTEVETPVLAPSSTSRFSWPAASGDITNLLVASETKIYGRIGNQSSHRHDITASMTVTAKRWANSAQLDLEMSFAKGEDVMRTVESIVSDLAVSLNSDFSVVDTGEEVYLAPKKSLLNRVDHILPRSFVSMITHLENPVVEAFRFRPNSVGEGQVPTSSFVDGLMKTLPPALSQNPDGAPVALIIDSSKPLRGLSPLGFEGAGALESSEMPGLADFEDGDVLVFQARKDEPFQGGSTAIGTFRSLVYQTAVSKGLLPRDLSFKFLWVNNFPMFTPDNETDPGQGGHAGFSATHHPFTAPLTNEDVELLATNPLKARGDHYDLVVNGVELGGGSRRIHVAKMQEYIMREILKMTDSGVAQFSHLLEALRAGCPPHAGFALGFDRLVAVLTYTDSVRDVIAFPKSMKGEDLTVKSPGRITKEQLDTYHLAFPSKT
ncbi:hypothetical protein CHGG_00896 [Chaetomium globosum CBS 148.51]|uniref:Aminoacyl-transfer RNA synthetases class-II family profile domain-containing protein n=1 Tax=Chaetomium globosum (strain ATCC 6205 / CBS 148.51 / DSM 1962 / NBRC 6347 / NRRL 1970) TaxID=306901 RepID=Q2HFV8_CHAGB|nr:uncharacterized protein CHGG_00896 [Chaetomium globosum CBS 148.51]EAQ92661.1 hypothetical protein CHGG_00896 [Chaetomium globosum CBS 148.51]